MRLFASTQEVQSPCPVYSLRPLKVVARPYAATFRVFIPYPTPRVLWGPILPQDRSRLVQDEETLVRSGIHSRRRAMSNLGVEDLERELALVGEEANTAVT